MLLFEKKYEINSNKIFTVVKAGSIYWLNIFGNYLIIILLVIIVNLIVEIIVITLNKLEPLNKNLLK